jgi:DHA1 family inner membrane transport protein
MKRILYVLALGVFGTITTEFGVIGILPQLAGYFNITIDKAGWLLSAFALVVALFGPFMVLLFSGLNRKWAIMVALSLFIVSNIISARAPSFWVLLLARILPAFVHPVFWSAALSMAASSVPAAESPKAVGIVFGGFTVASVTGIPLATYISDLFGWPASFWLCTVLNGIALLGVIAWLPSIPVTNRVSYRHHLNILNKGSLWIHLALACCMIAGMYSSYGYLAAYLQGVTGMTGAQVSLMLMIFGAAGVGGNWLAGRLLSKNVPKTTIAFIVLLSISLVLVYFAGVALIPMMIIIVVWGFIHTGGFLISNVNVTATAPESPEFVNSIFTSCGNLAITIGSTLGGLTIAHLGIHQVIWTSIVLLALSSLIWLMSVTPAKS